MNLNDCTVIFQFDASKTFETRDEVVMTAVCVRSGKTVRGTYIGRL